MQHFHNMKTYFNLNTSSEIDEIVDNLLIEFWNGIACIFRNFERTFWFILGNEESEMRICGYFSFDKSNISKAL